MNKNKGVIGIGLILAIVLGIVVVGGGAYYLRTKKNTENNKVIENTSVTNPIEENNSHEVPTGPYGDETNYVAPKPLVDNKKTDTINSATKTISTTLPAKYIGAQEGWPPVISNNSSATYSCVTGITNRDINEQTIEKIINGRKYCIKSSSEGAAGSFYPAYTYTTASPSGFGVDTTSFVFRVSSCGGYDKPESDQCQVAVATFLSNIDAIVDSTIIRVRIN